MTSNLGSEYLLTNDSDKYDKVMELVHHTFKPEFLNRIDEIVMFNSLTKDVQEKIAEKMLNNLKMRLQSENIEVSFSKNVIDYVLKEAFNITFGARPLKRFIQKNIETYLAKEIIKENIKPFNKYTVDVLNNEIVIKND